MKPILRLLALLAAFVLVVAACGDSSDDGETTDETTDTTEETTDTTAEDDGDGAMVDTSEFDDMEFLTAEDQIALITAKVDGGEWGLDGDILTGPEGYTIDLSECPSNWSNTGGLSEDTIELGQSMAQSGTVAIYGTWTNGMNAYFQYINDEGGIGGRNIEMETLDDAYEAARAVSNIDELISKDVFTFGTVLGTPMNLAVYDAINDACIPHLYLGTGHPAWGDPEYHPWTAGSAVFLGYGAEGTLWGEFVKENASELPTDVAVLVGNNDAGVAWFDSFEAYAEENPDVISSISVERFEATAPNVTNEITTLAADEPPVFILAFGTIYCPQVMDEIANRAWDPELKIIPSVCSTVNSFIPAGDNAEGWITLQATKDVIDTRFDGDEFVELSRQVITDAGFAIDDGFTGQGISNAYPLVENLRVADALPGGLTRTNMMLAVRTMRLEHPLLLDGIAFELNGNADGHTIEGGQFVQYTIPEGADEGSLEPFGDVFDVNGTTPNCEFGEDPVEQC